MEREKFQPDEREKEDGSQCQRAGDIGAGQSVHPLVTGACELALWAVAFGFFLTCIEIRRISRYSIHF